MADLIFFLNFSNRAATRRCQAYILGVETATTKLLVLENATPRMDLTPFGIKPARTRPTEEPAANPDATKRLLSK